MKYPILTAKDMIDILSDYSIEHAASLPTLERGFDGICDYEHRKIWIADDSDLPERRDTLIHELYHAFYRLSGLSPSEEVVARNTRHLYRELFGTEPLRRKKHGQEKKEASDDSKKP